MKTDTYNYRNGGTALLALALPAMLFCLTTIVRAQGTAFTYQGQLQQGGSLANGFYDIRVGLYDTNAGGTIVAGPIINSAVAVSNGLFAITLDYGNVYDGTTYWLQISVRSNGLGGFIGLSPRQELTPTPYAIFAEGASAGGLTGTIPSGVLAGSYGGVLNLTNPADSFAGNGAGLTNVNAATLGGLSANQFWQLSGNSGTTPGVNFLGTIDNTALEFHVNSVRAFRLILRTDSTGTYSNAPNVIGGSSVNLVKVGTVGGTVGGGGGNGTNGTAYPNQVNANFGTVSGGAGNNASGPGSFIGGGGTDGSYNAGNLASGQASVIGGGMYNTNSGYASTIAGGYQNNANSTTGGFFSGGATVSGGEANSATTDNATVGGGILNKATGFASTVPGGELNIAGGTGSFAAGQSAQTTQNGTFIWGDGSQVFNGEPVDDGFNVLASGGVFFYEGTNGVHIDGFGNNNGTLDFGLKFGGALSSGEGIASKRTSGGNQYGLDFYTRSVNQMSLESGGALRVNDNDIYLRTTADSNHDGLAYRDTFAGFTFDGPLLWGYSGGALGTVVPNEVSLTWDYNGNVWISNNCSVATLTIRGGADVAEPFQITAADDEAVPGSVVVIDEENPGRLKLSREPYDAHVAGVVSGANGINPGIQMQQQGLLEGGKNVALTGRVYVQADTSNGAIKPGDLLTTSRIPGHAMRVSNHAKAQGAILGKAMTGLSDGKGMVLVLVTLQ